MNDLLCHDFAKLFFGDLKPNARISVEDQLDSLPLNLTFAQQTIYDELLCDVITWEEAATRLKDLPPAWGSKEWQVNREKILKTFCEECGTTAGIMVIQHPFHPPNISEIIMGLGAGILLEPFLDKAKEQMLEEYAFIQTEQRECCPKCDSVSVRWHKTDQVWKCKSIVLSPNRRKVACQNTFKEPSYRLEYSPASKKALAALNSRAYEKAKTERWETLCREYGKEAVITSLRWSSWYLSLEGTKTFCKKCAFLADKNIIDFKQSQPRNL